MHSALDQQIYRLDFYHLSGTNFIFVDLILDTCKYHKAQAIAGICSSIIDKKLIDV
jgi:hypothetical protein